MKKHVKSKLEENDCEPGNRVAVEEPQEMLETRKKECAILNVFEDILGDQEAVDKPEENNVCENQTTSTLGVAHSLYPLHQHLCGTVPITEEENDQYENERHNIGKLSDKSEFSNSLPDLKTEDILNESYTRTEDKIKIETLEKVESVEEVSDSDEIICTDESAIFSRKGNDTKPQLEMENNKMVRDLDCRIEENVPAFEHEKNKNRITTSRITKTVKHDTKEVITNLLHELIIQACDLNSGIKNDAPPYVNNCSEYDKKINIKSSKTERGKGGLDTNKTIVNDRSSEWQDLPFEGSRQNVNSFSEKQDKDALYNNFKSNEGEINTEMYNRAGRGELRLNSNETKKTDTSSETADLGKNTKPDLDSYSHEMEKQLKYLFKKDPSNDDKLDLEKEMNEIEKQLVDLCEEEETNGTEEKTEFVLETEDIGEKELQEQDYRASQSHSTNSLFCRNREKTIVEGNGIGSIPACSWVIVPYKHPNYVKSQLVTSSVTKSVTEYMTKDIEGDSSNDRRYDGDSEEENSSNKKFKPGPLENLNEPNYEDYELFIGMSSLNFWLLL